MAAADELTVLLHRAIEVDAGLAQQARLQLADQDVQLARAHATHASTDPGEPVPRPRKREEGCGRSVSMCRQHRAHAALAVDVGTGDDPLAAPNPVEHRPARRGRQAVDRQTQVLDESRAVVAASCHRLWSVACAC